MCALHLTCFDVGLVLLFCLMQQKRMPMFKHTVIKDQLKNTLVEGGLGCHH